MKTFLRWSGNKSKYLKYILPHLPPKYNVYIEPFLGSGAIFLNLAPQKWIVNDLNGDLVCIWKLVAEDPKYIIKTFKNFEKQFASLSHAEVLAFCRTMTDNLNKQPASSRRTVNMLFMMYCCYMGQIHHKDKYYFNGLELNIAVNNRYTCFEKNYYENLLEVSSFLGTGKKIYNTDYKKILLKAKTGDFVFLDPPYIENQVDYKFKYNQDELLDKNFVDELYHQAKLLDEKGVMWMMTQANTPLVRKTFKEYKMIRFPVFRARTNCKKYELLIMNY